MTSTREDKGGAAVIKIINKTGGNLPLLEVIRTKTTTNIGIAPVIKHQIDKDGNIVGALIDNEEIEKKYLKLIESRYSNPVMRHYLESGKLVILTDIKKEIKKIKKGSETVEKPFMSSGKNLMEGKYFGQEKNKWSLMKEEIVKEESATGGTGGDN